MELTTHSAQRPDTGQISNTVLSAKQRAAEGIAGRPGSLREALSQHLKEGRVSLKLVARQPASQRWQVQRDRGRTGLDRASRAVWGLRATTVTLPLALREWGGAPTSTSLSWGLRVAMEGSGRPPWPLGDASGLAQGGGCGAERRLRFRVRLLGPEGLQP